MGGNTGCGRARAGFARFPSRGPAGSDFSVLEKRVLLRSARPQFLRSESERGAGKRSAHTQASGLSRSRGPKGTGKALRRG